MYRVPRERRDKPCRYHNWNSVEKAVICNGCGPKGGWLNPPDFMFTASCDHHDANYWLGGTEQDRKHADNQFLEAMLTDADMAPAWRRWWYKTVAWRYFWAVRWFGRACFHYGVPQRDWLDLEITMRDAGYDVEANFD